MKSLFRALNKIALEIQKDATSSDLLVLREPEIPSVQIIPEILVRNCRPYIKRIVREVNGTYEKGFFSSSAVMMRRLVETCMIEAFENRGLSASIKNPDGDYKTADEIKNELLQDPFGNLSRNVKRALSHRKNVITLGDQCAHDRFFTAQKSDVDDIRNDMRVLIEYLICQFT